MSTVYVEFKGISILIDSDKYTQVQSILSVRGCHWSDHQGLIVVHEGRQMPLGNALVSHQDGEIIRPLDGDYRNMTMANLRVRRVRRSA